MLYLKTNIDGIYYVQMIIVLMYCVSEVGITEKFGRY